MKVKLLEVRDAGTFVAVLAIDMQPETGTHPMWEAQRYLLRRCGYPCDGRPNIGLTYLDASGRPFWNDPYGWANPYHRTIPVAHNYIIEHWDQLVDGDVIDVEHILGERAEPKVSERISERDL